MNRKLILGGLAALASLTATPATASAKWYLTRATATQAARHQATLKYGNTSTSAWCRPYGRDTADPAYDYHRWVCGWAGFWTNDDGSEVTCHGLLSIAGSRYYQYQWRVIKGERCS